jgi:hypothetical protein
MPLMDMHIAEIIISVCNRKEVIVHKKCLVSTKAKLHLSSHVKIFA